MAKRSAHISIGRRKPVEARAGIISARRGTAMIPNPGIPVLEIPMKREVNDAMSHPYHGKVSMARRIEWSSKGVKHHFSLREYQIRPNFNTL
jgi:hypothetical protein